jgi:hypothetical protein
MVDQTSPFAKLADFFSRPQKRPQPETKISVVIISFSTYFNRPTPQIFRRQGSTQTHKNKEGKNRNIYFFSHLVPKMFTSVKLLEIIIFRCMVYV